jgi:rod shape determining protein RodA
MFNRAKFFSVYKREPAILVGITALIVLGLMALRSIASDIFPSYFLYIIAGLLAFIIFSQIDFDILLLFNKHLYVLSLVSLLLPLFLGQVTRGAVRWIQLGPFTVQPTELVRPFLILFFASYLTAEKLTMRRVIKAGILLAVPLVLILLQPSLGVTVLTFMGFAGVALSLEYNKKLLLFTFAAAILAVPIFWLLLAPYQRQRVEALISPATDPAGAGYNSIQSMIAVGSGKLTGRGLGEGVQTQLYFLPERHTDFIFASIAEELGFAGAFLLITLLAFVLFRVVKVLENARSPVARAFVSGVFLTLFVQIMVHVGMNMGLLPITGLPLPLVSAGGSSLIATMSIFGILLQAKSDEG